MHQLDDIRTRLATTYNIRQILRFVAGMAAMGTAAALFPDDFPLIRDGNLFYVFIGLSVLIWVTLFTVIIRRRLDRATTLESVVNLARFETRWFSMTITTAAILMPLASVYYVNLAWFMSAFLYCYVLANPLLETRLANTVCLSPVLGWILHSSFHFMINGTPVHWPALLFCLVIVATLFYSRSYLIHNQLRATLVTNENTSTDAVATDDQPLEKAFADHHGLSRREAEVLGRVFRGRSTKEISAELGISQATVKSHITNIFNKTCVHTRVELFTRFNRFARIGE